VTEPIYATPQEAEALERQGLVKQHVIAQLTNFTPTTSTVEIRNATINDIDDLIRLELAFEEHMRSEPINAEIESETESEMRAGFEEQLTLANFVTLVALEHGYIIGMTYACSTEYSKLHSGERRPLRSATLAKVVVDPGHRRKGIGSALATAVIVAVQELGMEAIVSDWRLANVEANETWTKLGFTPTWYRMIDPV
jgi:ribosomal protein S18 acetylase RimI-like enzyme